MNDDDRHERDEVIPVPARQRAQLHFDGGRHGRHSELARVELDHQEQRQVVEDRRDRRHQQHVEVADLQELRDQERRGAQHRRRDDRAEPARCQQSAGRVLRVTGALEHRPGHRADRHRGRDAGAGRPAQQERREHHGAPGPAVLAAHRGEAPVEEELARARVLQERAVDREQDDERRRDVDRGAEDPLERLVQEAREARHVVAAVRPLARQPRSEESVGEEERDHEQHDPAGRAPHRLEHEHDERRAEDHVPAVGQRVAVPEVVAAREQVDDRGDRRPTRARRPTT